MKKLAPTLLTILFTFYGCTPQTTNTPAAEANNPSTQPSPTIPPTPSNTNTENNNNETNTSSDSGETNNASSNNETPRTPDFFDSCSPVQHNTETYEPNNSLCQAYQLDINNDNWINATLSPSDYTDYYAYKVKANHSYTLQVRESTGDYGSYKGLQILTTDEETTKLLDIYASDSPSKTFTATQTGWIFIKFYSQNPSSHIFKFRLLKSTADGLAHDSITFEPNDDPNIAMPVEVNRSYTSSITTTDLADTYEINVTNGQNLSIQLQDLGDTTGYYYWKIFDENEVAYLPQKAIGNDQTQSKEITIVGSHKLYIQIYNSNYPNSHRYTLYIN